MIMKVVLTGPVDGVGADFVLEVAIARLEDARSVRRRHVVRASEQVVGAKSTSQRDAQVL